MRIVVCKHCKQKKPYYSLGLCEQCYNSRPEVKEKMKEYRARPEVKEKMKEYRARPEVKEKMKEYYALHADEVKEKMKEYRARPEVKEKMKEAWHKKHPNSIPREKIPIIALSKAFQEKWDSKWRYDLHKESDEEYKHNVCRFFVESVAQVKGNEVALLTDEILHCSKNKGGVKR